MEVNGTANVSLEGIFLNGIVDTEYLSNIKIIMFNSNEENSSEDYSISIVVGTLPSGLSLKHNGNLITLEGIPTKGGTYAFTLRVTSKASHIDKIFRVTIVDKNYGKIDNSLSIYGNFKDCELRTTYRTYFNQNKIILSGQHRPYITSLIRGELPSGLSVVRYGTSVCLIGTPDKVGKYNFALRFVGVGNHYNEKEFIVNVVDNRKLPYPEANMSIIGIFGNIYYGTYSSSFVEIQGNHAPYTNKVISGSLPSGLSLRVQGNYIYLEGVSNQEGTFNFTLRVTDKYNGYVDKDFSINIGDTLDYNMYINFNFRDAIVGEKYSEFIYIKGKTTSYTPIISKGTLPIGLKLRQSMIRTYLEGTPTQVGTYNFTLRITGNNHRYTEKNFTINISA